MLIVVIAVAAAARARCGCRCCGGAEHKFRDPADVIYPLLHHGYMRGEGAEALVRTFSVIHLSFRLGLRVCCKSFSRV